MDNKRVATYQDEHDLSSVYVYVVPKDDFPEPENLYSEARDTEITLDFERGTGRLLGIEIITRTKPQTPR